jgi:hypothetical protein
MSQSPITGFSGGTVGRCWWHDSIPRSEEAIESHGPVRHVYHDPTLGIGHVERLNSSHVCRSVEKKSRYAGLVPRALGMEAAGASWREIAEELRVPKASLRKACRVWEKRKVNP